MNVKIEDSWKAVLADEFSSIYFTRLAAFVKEAYAKGVVYPPGKYIFEAFNRTPFNKVKVVILGQDPYHEPNQAHGLCFSVRKGVQVPPSLINIYKELEQEYGTPFLNRDGDLTHWADQGVLLLNATLTVAAGLLRHSAQETIEQERLTPTAYAIWEHASDQSIEPEDGMLGVAVVVPGAKDVCVHEDLDHGIATREIASGETFTYYYGSCWSKGDLKTADAWFAEVEKVK